MRLGVCYTCARWRQGGWAYVVELAWRPLICAVCERHPIQRCGKRMAVEKRRDPGLEALILKAAADVRRHNPQIGEKLPPLSESDHAQIQRDAQELERVWDEMERQRGGPPIGEPAAHAVDEDRGA